MWARAALPPIRQGFSVKTVPTTPKAGQKTGTSGLRKKTKEFMSENYLANWCGTRGGAERGRAGRSRAGQGREQRA